MCSGQFFNAVIIDTNAFDSKNNDFCGYYNRIIPSFFSSLKSNNIKLISHPVLIGETKKHIKHGVGTQTGGLNQRIGNALTAINKYQDLLRLINCKYDDIILKLKNLDLEKANLDYVDKLFAKAEILDFCNPSVIFKKYFNAEPPFAKSGDKKSEFPDAFVIESIIDYIKNHPSDKILIVSNDKDWKSSLDDNTQVSIVDTIDDALKTLNNQEERINEIIKSFYQDIEDFINNITYETWFDIYDYDIEDDIDIESAEIESISDDYTPLYISDNEIILQTDVNILVSGTTTFINYDNSIWDSERKEYIFTAIDILEFQQARGEFLCELHIYFDEQNTPDLDEINVIAPKGIMLELDKDKVKISSYDFMADAEAEMMDTLEDYYRH